jgi:hypothetical protein
VEGGSGRIICKKVGFKAVRDSAKEAMEGTGREVTRGEQGNSSTSRKLVADTVLVEDSSGRTYSWTKEGNSAAPTSGYNTQESFHGWHHEWIPKWDPM